MHRGTPILRSLGTTNESIAELRARQIIDDAYNGNDLALRASRLRHETLNTTLDWYFYLLCDDALGIEKADFGSADSPEGASHLSVVRA